MFSFGTKFNLITETNTAINPTTMSDTELTSPKKQKSYLENITEPKNTNAFSVPGHKQATVALNFDIYVYLKAKTRKN